MTTEGCTAGRQHTRADHGPAHAGEAFFRKALNGCCAGVYLRASGIVQKSSVDPESRTGPWLLFHSRGGLLSKPQSGQKPARQVPAKVLLDVWAARGHKGREGTARPGGSPWSCAGSPHRRSPRTFPVSPRWRSRRERGPSFHSAGSAAALARRGDPEFLLRGSAYRSNGDNSQVGVTSAAGGTWRLYGTLVLPDPRRAALLLSSGSRKSSSDPRVPDALLARRRRRPSPGPQTPARSQIRLVTQNRASASGVSHSF